MIVKHTMCNPTDDRDQTDETSDSRPTAIAVVFTKNRFEKTKHIFLLCNWKTRPVLPIPRIVAQRSLK